MLKEIPLESTKYLKDAVDRQYRDYKRQRSRKAIRSFVMFLSILACFFLGVLFAQQVPHWMPMLNFIHN